MRIRILILFLIALLSVAALPACGAPPALEVEKRSITTHPQRLIDGSQGPWVYLPYFDNERRLHWSDEQVAEAGGCAADWFPEGGIRAPRCHRTTVLLNPRVDECYCIGEIDDGRVGSGIAFVGVGDDRAERWRRIHQSPPQRMTPSLVSAHAEGMVFSNREIWSPATGETIRPRSGAVENYYPTYHLPGTNLFLEFNADVTLFHSKGGLYLHEPEAGKRELVLPVDDRLRGYFDIDDIAALPGGRWILLAEDFNTRGPGKVRFEIFDLEERRIVFKEEFAKGHYVSMLKITLGPEGNVAFSFLKGREFVVVHYLIRSMMERPAPHVIQNAKSE